MYQNNDGTLQPMPGMSKRFYAACNAMQGLLSGNRQLEGTNNLSPELVAKISYKFADEILKQENI